MFLHPLFDNKMARWMREQGYDFPPKIVVSFSGGKDSTAMLLRLVEWGYPIAAVLFFDTGWEFPEMYNHIKKVEAHIGYPIIRLHSKIPFDEMLKKYRWPEPGRTWCRRVKINAERRYIKESFKKTSYIIHCVGMAQDELKRTDRQEQVKKGNVMYPLISDYIHNPVAVKYCYDRDMAMTEKEALNYCYEKGFDWENLYKKFHRVSCFCCPQKRIGELRTIHKEYPGLWAKMVEMEKSIDTSTHYATFRNKKTINDLAKRFKNESRQTVWC